MAVIIAIRINTSINILRMSKPAVYHSHLQTVIIHCSSISYNRAAGRGMSGFSRAFSIQQVIINKQSADIRGD